MAGWIKTALGMEVGLSPGNFVLDWDPAPIPKKGAEPFPFFSPFLLWPNGWMHQDATSLGVELGLSPGDFVLDGDPALLPKKGGAPQFSANIRCGQTAGWIKMPLGMEVRLGPGDLVFDGDPTPLPPEKGHTTSTQFLAHVCCGQTAGWVKMPLGTDVNLDPGDVVRDAVAAPPKRGTAPSFWFMSVVAKRLDG